MTSPNIFNPNSQYGYYYNSVTPNPHIHNITPNPHAHEITPNPHRHAMRFLESGSFTDTALENSCRVGPEVLINLIYNSLNTETAKEKSRVSEAAKKGNWITANKLGRPIWDYLENYYIRRVICYLQARVWFTEYETLGIIPTTLDILPTGLILTNNGSNVVGPQGMSTPSTIQESTPVHADAPMHVDTPVHNDTPVHADAPPAHTDVPPQINYIQCRPPGGPCSFYQAESCAELGIPGTFTEC